MIKLKKEGLRQTLFYLIMLMFASCNTLATATLCEQNEDTLDCRGRGLTHIPQIPPGVTKVLLDDNALSDINDKAFEKTSQLRYLSLKNNALDQLHVNTFQGLISLTYLHLGQNRLCLGNDSYPSGVFQSVPKLETLNIASNKCKGSHGQYYPEEAFADLKSLTTFALSGLRSKLGYGFAAMTNLRTLMFIGNSSNMTRIDQDYFESLENLNITRLSLRNTNLQEMSPRLLKPLKHLEYLNLACNSFLTTSDVVRLVSNMAGPTLHTLSLDSIANGRGEVTHVSSDDFVHPHFGSIKRVSMHLMAIVSIHATGLRFLANLETLVLGHIRFIADRAEDFSKTSAEILRNSSLRYLAMPYFDDPKYSRISFQEEYCIQDDIDTEDDLFFRGIDAKRKQTEVTNELQHEQSFSCLHEEPNLRQIYAVQRFEGLFFQCLPPNIHTLSLDHTQMAVITRLLSQDINPMNKVKTLNLTNMVSSRGSLDFKPLSKFPMLQVLEAKHCRIQSIEINFLNLEHLTDLNLDNNDMEYIKSSFGGIPNLNKLSIRNNQISRISPNVFKGLTKLTHVLLSGNYISNVFFILGPNPLKLLDISSNLLPYLDNDFLEQLNEHSDSLTLDMSDNKLSCNCKILPFSNWLRDTVVNVVDRQKLTCTNGKNLTVLVTDALSKTERLTCYTWFMPVMAIIAISLIFFIVVLLSYKFRWKIQLGYYILRRRLRLRVKRGQCGLLFWFFCNPLYKKLANEGKSDFIYDGFLAHDGLDFNFIIDGFSDKIESWGVKLYISERDGEVGKAIIHNLVDAIDSSRLVICLLTPGFAQSDWCDFELKMALDRGKETVIFVYKEHIPWKIASKTLGKIILENNFLEYTEDPDGNTLFWRKLKEILTKGMETEENPEMENNSVTQSIEMPDWKNVSKI